MEKAKIPSEASSTKFPKAVLALAGVPLGAIDGNADLPESHPTAQAPQVAMVFGQAAKLLHHAARDQGEIARVERQV